MFTSPVVLQPATTGPTTGSITAVATPAAGEPYFYLGDPAYKALFAVPGTPGEYYHANGS